MLLAVPLEIDFGGKAGLTASHRAFLCAKQDAAIARKHLSRAAPAIPWSTPSGRLARPRSPAIGRKPRTSALWELCAPVVGDTDPSRDPGIAAIGNVPENFVEGGDAAGLPDYP